MFIKNNLKNIWTLAKFCGIVISTTIGEQMITREQAIAIAEDYFNGDFKANYCEHRFEYAESEKRWYGIVYLHEPDWSNLYAGDTTLHIPYEFYIDESGKLTEMNYGYSMNELVW
jgi:hypothetical protein